MKINSSVSDNARHDAELVNQACSGAEAAYAQLMMRYKKVIYCKILKMVNNKREAEDLMMETFEKAFVNIHQYQFQFAFSPWLFTIASNTAIDFLRKKKVITVSYESELVNNEIRGVGYSYSLPTMADNPEEAFIKKQTAKIIQEAVSVMKPRYQTVLDMRYFKQYSHSEICDALNLPLGTVKTRLLRSREILHNRLKRVGYI